MDVLIISQKPRPMYSTVELLLLVASAGYKIQFRTDFTKTHLIITLNGQGKEVVSSIPMSLIELWKQDKRDPVAMSLEDVLRNMNVIP